MENSFTLTVSGIAVNVSRSMSPDDISTALATAINQRLASFAGELGCKLDLDWTLENAAAFSKMIARAQDKAGYSVVRAGMTDKEVKAAKKARSSQFAKVCAIFDVAGINDGIRDVLDELGYVDRFGGFTKAGDAKWLSVTPKKARGEDADRIGKAASAMVTATRNVELSDEVARLRAENEAFKKALPAKTPETANVE